MSTPRLLPPGPRGHFLSGNLREFRRDMLGFLEKCTRDYGDVVSLRLGRRSIYLLNHPDLLEEVLLADGRKFKKDFAKRNSRSLMGNGLLSSWGEIWFQQRRLCQPAFHRDRLGPYCALMVDHIRHQLADWQEGESLDIAVAMKRIALGCVSRPLFGTDIGDDFRTIEDCLETVQAIFVSRLGKVFPMPLRVPTIDNLRFKRVLRRLDEVIYRHIKNVPIKEEGRNLLALLRQARDEEGRCMSDLEVRNQVVTLLVAGYETTALALVWTWYLLSRHPQVEQRVVEEVRQVMGDRPPRLEDLSHLSYTQQVMQEALRLYPPSYLLGREALFDGSIGEYAISAGQTLWFSQWLMQRDPRFFDRPTEFDPDRWADGLASRLPRFAYFPFGGGPRLCIGISIAQTEMLLVTALLAQKYRFSHMAGEPIRPEPTYTLRPGPGTNVVLTRR